VRTARRIDGGIIVGNRFDKHGSRDPLVRWTMRRFENSMFKLLEGIGPVHSVLEVGCGEGFVTASLTRAFPGARVLGTDFSPMVIDDARSRHPGVEFKACSVYDSPSLGRFDLVVACEVLEHLEDPDRALRAMNAVATGHILATVPREPLWRILNMLRGRYWSALGNTDGHLQHWSRGSFIRFLSTRVDVVAVRSPLPWTQVLARPRAVTPS
jgi:2-polyprenyl-3-methyl-5-hydroxy-6-metoxy-1,4-benzoquinol methylase